MRILALTNAYPPEARGGYGEIAADVMGGLVTRGHEVRVLCCGSGSGPEPAPGGELVDRRLSYVLGAWRRPAAAWRGVRTDEPLLRATLAEGWDACLVWHMRGVLKTNLRLVHEAGLPVLYQLHDRWALYERPGSLLVPWPALDRLGATRARNALARIAMPLVRRELRAPPIREKGVVCFVSRWLADWHRDAGWTPRRCELVPCGVDVARFAAARTTPAAAPPRTVLFAGRIEERKGLHVALAALAASRSRLRLTIAGPVDDPEYLRRMREQVRALGLGERVVFAGELTRDEVVRQLGEHDVLLYPSTGPEAYSLGLLEGMAAGAVVVTSAPGGPREYLRDGVNSLVFEPGDVGALVAALDLLEDEPALTTRLTEGARATATEFSLDSVVEQLARLMT